jgi:hypothetical protein
MRGQHDRERLCPGVVVTFIVDRDAHGDAGIVDDDIEAAEMRGDVIDDLDDVIVPRDIERPGLCRAAARGNFIRDRLRALGTEVGDGDLGAFGRENMRSGASHAAGGAGDENGKTLHRTAELSEIGHGSAREQRLMRGVPQD